MSNDADAIFQAIDAPFASVQRPPSSVETVVQAIPSSGAEREGEARGNAAPALDNMGRRAFWELRHARLRLAIAENDIAWAQELLVHGSIAPRIALCILDEILDDVAGVRP